MERLNNLVRKERRNLISNHLHHRNWKRISCRTFIRQTRRDTTEAISSVVTEAKDASDVPVGKIGSGASPILDLTAMTFSEKNRLNSSTITHEHAGGRPQPNNWLTDLHSLLATLSNVRLSHQNAPHLVRQRSHSYGIRVNSRKQYRPVCWCKRYAVAARDHRT